MPNPDQTPDASRAGRVDRPWLKPNQCHDCPYVLPTKYARCPLCPNKKFNDVVEDVSTAFKADVDRIMKDVSLSRPTSTPSPNLDDVRREARRQAFEEASGAARAWGYGYSDRNSEGARAAFEIEAAIRAAAAADPVRGEGER